MLLIESIIVFEWIGLEWNGIAQNFPLKCAPLSHLRFRCNRRVLLLAGSRASDAEAPKSKPRPKQMQMRRSTSDSF